MADQLAAAVMINGGESEMKVMMAIDESDYSHYALIWVLDNLKEVISESSFVIFMAQPSPLKLTSTFAGSVGCARMYCPVSTALAPELVNSVQDNHKKMTLAFLQKAKDICAARGVKAEIITEVGDPRTTICDVVEKLNINLLVLGDHGLGKIKRALIGSVSNYCVQNAKCPVLVVKKP